MRRLIRSLTAASSDAHDAARSRGPAAAVVFLSCAFPLALAARLLRHLEAHDERQERAHARRERISAELASQQAAIVEAQDALIEPWTAEEAAQAQVALQMIVAEEEDEEVTIRRPVGLVRVVEQGEDGCSRTYQADFPLEIPFEECMLALVESSVLIEEQERRAQ